jgi:4,5-dihydroxyphthalate decarboxylase
MPEPKLTLAVEHYDRHLPLLDRTVTAEGIQLDVRHITVESGRHERMLDGLEWDCAELSLSSYIMAITRGAPLTAIPVFPRRLFSQSQMYVNTAAGINGPQDLIGKKVGLRSFQTTLSVLAKGDLQHEYGIPLDQVNWITSTDEPVSFQAPAGVSIERAPQGSNIETMLVQGEIDAYMVPRMPVPFVAGAPEVGRLFQDSRSEEISYFQRNGFYPIMHLVAIKQEVADQHPEVTAALFTAFEQAKEAAFRFYDDPNWSSMAWAPQLAQEEQLIMGGDPWPNGLEHNQSNLERFIQYELDQGLIDDRLEVEDLFHPSCHSL